jgi:hypothetical protein
MIKPAMAKPLPLGDDRPSFMAFISRPPRISPSKHVIKPMQGTTLAMLRTMEAIERPEAFGFGSFSIELKLSILLPL